MFYGYYVTAPNNQANASLIPDPYPLPLIEVINKSMLYP